MKHLNFFNDFSTIYLFIYFSIVFLKIFFLSGYSRV